MALFDNGELEEFLLFILNFKMTLNALGRLAATPKLQYLRKILHEEALHQFDTLCAQLGRMTIAHSNRALLGLGTYFPHMNALSKENRTMCRVMRNPRELKVRC